MERHDKLLPYNILKYNFAGSTSENFYSGVVIEFTLHNIVLLVTWVYYT